MERLSCDVIAQYGVLLSATFTHCLYHVCVKEQAEFGVSFERVAFNYHPVPVISIQRTSDVLCESFQEAKLREDMRGVERVGRLPAPNQ